MTQKNIKSKSTKTLRKTPTLLFLEKTSSTLDSFIYKSEEFFPDLFALVEK